MGRGPAEEDPVQVAVLGRHAGGTGSGNVHLHCSVLRVRGGGGGLHLRGVAKRAQGPSTTTQRGRRNRCFRFAALAAAAIHGIPSGHSRREDGRLQERDGRRQETERHPREGARCQGVQTTAQHRGLERQEGSHKRYFFSRHFQ